MSEINTHVLLQRVILGLLLGGLLLLGHRVLHLFFAPVAWAIILAYVTWPVYRHLRLWLRGHPTGSALLMTLLLSMIFALPVVWLLDLLRAELPAVHQAVSGYLIQGPSALPESIVRIPWLGRELEQLLGQLVGDRDALQAQLAEWAKPWVDEVTGILGDAGRNLIKFGLAVLTAFFIYRDGETLLQQTRQILQRLLGERAKAYLIAVGDTTRAVLYGLVLTALAQGVLAGLGYWIAGVRAPVLLGAVTAMFALIPFGTPLVWGAVGAWALLTGHTWAGIGVLLWGALVVSQVDNLIRPMVISGATRIPFLLVMFGVLGGIAAFGLIGLFLGPVVVAMLLAVWREWLEEQTQAPPAT